jgi:hypothetical protein
LNPRGTFEPYFRPRTDVEACLDVGAGEAVAVGVDAYPVDRGALGFQDETDGPTLA